MTQIVTKAEAKARGLKKYFTGKPCKHGHISERNTIHSNCVECQKNASRTYYLNHPDWWRASNRRSYRKHRAKRLEHHKTKGAKIRELLAVLRTEMPDLLKEFGL